MQLKIGLEVSVQWDLRLLRLFRSHLTKNFCTQVPGLETFNGVGAKSTESEVGLLFICIAGPPRWTWALFGAKTFLLTKTSFLK